MDTQRIVEIARACHDASLALQNDLASCQIVCTALEWLLAENGVQSRTVSVAATIAHGRAPGLLAKHGLAELLRTNVSLTKREIEFLGCARAIRDQLDGQVPDLRGDGTRMMHCVLVTQDIIVDPTLDQVSFEKVLKDVYTFPLNPTFWTGEAQQFPLGPRPGGIIIYDPFPEDPYFMPFPRDSSVVLDVQREARILLAQARPGRALDDA